MKVVSVIGITDSGKTTTIENIIKELRLRNYTVGTVKEIHFHNFKMDVEGTNTDRHKKAGSQLVTARGENETDILFQEKLSLAKILSFYNHDYVILEGVREKSIPKILTAHNINGIEDRLDETVFAISGRISSELDMYKNIPSINGITNIQKLVDLIEKNAIEFFQDKKEAGYKVLIEGKEVNISSELQELLCHTMKVMTKELGLHIYNEDTDICIRKRDL